MAGLQTRRPVPHCMLTTKNLRIGTQPHVAHTIGPPRNAMQNHAARRLAGLFLLRTRTEAGQGCVPAPERAGHRRGRAVPDHIERDGARQTVGKGTSGASLFVCEVCAW